MATGSGLGDRRGNVAGMDVNVTEAALALARRKGGNIALDFIRPVG